MSRSNVFFEANLKSNLSSKNYDTCISMLNDEIQSFYVDKIRKYNKYFKYTNMLDLLTMSKEYLSSKEYNQLKKFYFVNTRDCSQSCELVTLLNVYKELGKPISSESNQSSEQNVVS